MEVLIIVSCFLLVLFYLLNKTAKKVENYKKKYPEQSILKVNSMSDEELEEFKKKWMEFQSSNKFDLKSKNGDCLEKCKDYPNCKPCGHE